MSDLAVRLVRLLVLAYVGYLALLFVVQRAVAFPGTMRPPPRPSPSAPAGVEQLWLDTSFGRVEAWLFLAPSPERAATAIFAHGNGELIDDWEEALARYAASGVNVLAVEFPGYGHSDGKPSRRSIAEAFSAAFDALAARPEIDGSRIVAHGRSMGGGAAGDLALARPVAGLILQSTFSSAAAIARESFAPGFLVRDRFDNLDAVRRFSGPVLLMHGRADDVIAFRHAERIASQREGLEVVELACAHNDCARAWPDVVATVGAFLSDNGWVDDD